MEHPDLPAPTPEQEVSDRVLEDVWQKTLSGVPSEFGKLVYLASLRDANSGVYHHYGLEQLYAPEQCDEALHRSHLEVFYRWLEKSLEEQKDDLEFYLRSVEGELPAILDNWELLQPYLGYAPAGATDSSRQWFLSDLRIILKLLAPSRRSTA
jgi:hypothetical protein